MHVIGTAGHIDHGKTTLIQALTGMNADRLPEEQERGMTIDLGFAWFADDNEQQIGVIDVPGHERFIRNMVAGAWGIDCALLLVAADDGWMQQTQDHAVILRAHDLRSVILVVTKIDAVPRERVQEVERDAQARATAIFGVTPPLISVSARSQEHIDDLRRLILDVLSKLPPRFDEAGFPYLYIDRVFSMKGVGHVVTGTLVGGALDRSQQLELLPYGERLGIRTIQAYNTEVECAIPTCRVAVNLRKPRTLPVRGDCLTIPDSPFSSESEIVARIEDVMDADSCVDRDGSQPHAAALRDHSEVEIALGTGHVIAQIHFLTDSRFARLTFRRKLPMLWNQPFLIIRHGGSVILGSGKILWFGKVVREQRARLVRALTSLPERPKKQDKLRMEAVVRGMVRLQNNQTELDDAAQSGLQVVGYWAFEKGWLKEITTRILALAASPAGVSLTELSSKLVLEQAALKNLLEYLRRTTKLVERGTYYFIHSVDRSEQLPKSAQALLEAMRQSMSHGFELEKGHTKDTQEGLNTLVRLGLAVPLTAELYLAQEAYQELVGSILAHKKPGERFSIADAKERTGLSRKYMIPLLNRMEKDRLVRREGNDRVVV